MNRGKAQTRDGAHGWTPNLFLRVALPIAAVAVAFGLRLALVPLTGTGAPYLLFFGAVLVTSLLLGAPSGVLAAILSAPIGAYTFVVRAGYSGSEAAYQAVLFFLECCAIIYVTILVTRARRSAEEAAERERRAARLRDELVAVVSHDLRSPLSSIRLAAGVITKALEVGDASQAERAAATVGRSAARMGKLIEDLLDVARAEAGVLKVSPRAELAAPLLHDTIDGLRSVADAKSVRLDYDGGGLEGVTIFCEGGRIAQVLSNLVGNAVKFTESGGSVKVVARAKERLLELEVTDTGPGIPEEQLPFVFERYWQSQRAGRAREGAGLGLAIARAFVERTAARSGRRASSERGPPFSSRSRATKRRRGRRLGGASRRTRRRRE